jgi:hypothetical protein
MGSSDQKLFSRQNDIARICTPTWRLSERSAAFGLAMCRSNDGSGQDFRFHHGSGTLRRSRRLPQERAASHPKNNGSLVMPVPAILMAIPMAVLAIAASTALAQQGLDPSAARSSVQSSPGVPQAPVGHRQPRLRDLPPDLARAQRSGELSKSEPAQSSEPTSPPTTSGSNATGKIIDDQRLRICRGC